MAKLYSPSGSSSVATKVKSFVCGSMNYMKHDRSEKLKMQEQNVSAIESTVQPNKSFERTAR